VWIWSKNIVPPYPIWSFIKTNIEVINGVLLTLATVAIGLFAWRSYRLERTRIKIELYDRRINIYQTIRTISENLDDLDFHSNNSGNFLTILRQSLFLFGNEKRVLKFVTDFLVSWNSYEFSRINNNHVGTQKQKVILKSMALELDKIFDKYLKIE